MQYGHGRSVDLLVYISNQQVDAKDENKLLKSNRSNKAGLQQRNSIEDEQTN